MEPLGICMDLIFLGKLESGEGSCREETEQSSHAVATGA